VKTADLTKLYIKERNYQEEVFGVYENDKSLNLASFLEFLRTYIDRATKSYTEEWTAQLPDWLLNSKEAEKRRTAPVATYDALIKVMTLAGAALETYAEIDVSKWRPNLRQS